MKVMMKALRLLALAAPVAFSWELRASRHQALEIGDATHSIVDYGAKGDGRTDDTGAFQRAIDACSKEGGGTVVVPEGGTFVFYGVAVNASHLLIRVDGTLVVGGRAEYMARSAADVFVLHDVTDVAITGGGVVDGGGAAWWPHKGEFRPHMVGARGVERLLIEGVTFLNPPSHCLELGATFVELAGVQIFAPPSQDAPLISHSTDGFDVHGAYAYVHGVNFTTGDDDVAFHANHTLVEDSYFGTGHGASIGSLCDAWITNVTVRNVTFHATTAGARIKTKPKCAGRVWDVTYEHLTMTDVKLPFDIDMFYPGHGDAKKTTMKIERVTFLNITSTGHAFSGSFLCDEDSPCADLKFKHVHLLGQKTDEWTCKHDKEGDACCQAASGEATDVQPPGLNECLQKS